MRPGYWLLGGLLVGFAVLLLGFNPEPAEATRHVPLQLSLDKPLHVAAQTDQTSVSIPAEASIEPAAADSNSLAEQSVQEHIPATLGDEWHDVTVKSGDSLALIFSRLEIPPQQLHKILELGGAAHNLKKIYPGQALRLLTNPELGLVKLEYPIDELSSMEVRRQADDFEIVTSHRTPERRIANASGAINSSLFLAGQEANLPDSLTMELANIFGWDIDFALDIRKGDQFALIYEELYLDGEKIDTGNILAAAFVNQGKAYQAVRYTDKSGRTDYYSPDGKSMRKAFLRTPVEFSRVSSRFNLKRKHPVLNRIRAHKGVDYAAPKGTPIRSTSNGKIIFRGNKGGYGNAIIVQHGTKYSTLYAHLSKFKSGLSKGSRVKQGQVIGYVGSSGLATGPHLHYELRVNGVHRDPLRMKLPGAEPLEKKYREDFKQKAGALIAQLDLVRNVQVASSE
ncbi:MAG: peptidoglycan DD-metalloendopeptidase family protein [Gammaproteobacteria bacterium]|nr:peptidoglycan DD-metalloendopeptidase family protein [Gammaproteobacteria bacterium]